MKAQDELTDIPHWKNVKKPKEYAKDMDDYIDSFRPKIIHQYEENGHIIKVYEAR